MSSSLDLLYTVSAIAIVWITVFFCWLCYSWIVASREFTKALKDWNERVEHMRTMVDQVREYVCNPSTIMKVASGVMGHVQDYIKDRKQKRPKNVKKTARKVNNKRFKRGLLTVFGKMGKILICNCVVSCSWRGQVF